MTFLKYAIGFFGFCALFVLSLAIWSNKKEPIEEEEGGVVREMYPSPDDPEYAQFKDNKPDWKPKRAQNN